MRRLLLLLLLLLLLHQIDLPVAAVVVVVPQPDLYHWHTLVWLPPPWVKSWHLDLKNTFAVIFVIIEKNIKANKSLIMFEHHLTTNVT